MAGIYPGPFQITKIEEIYIYGFWEVYDEYGRNEMHQEMILTVVWYRTDIHILYDLNVANFPLRETACLLDGVSLIPFCVSEIVIGALTPANEHCARFNCRRKESIV